MSELIELQQLVLAEEPFAQAWPDAARLAAEHANEVDGGIEPRRKWNPDTELMALMNLQGSFPVYTAREQVSGRLAGYITWTLTPDPESKGLLIGLMGPWYAEPGSRCGGRLMKMSIRELKKRGVQCLFPHHRTQGRGADLGPFFKLLGAQHIQNNYILWIGDN